MGRKRKDVIEKSPYKLRRRTLSDGRVSLFIDHIENGKHQYEFLRLYLLPDTTTSAKLQNNATLRKAEDLLRDRTEAFFNAKVVSEDDGVNGGMLLSDWLKICRERHEKRGARDLGSIDNARRALKMFRPDATLTDIDKQLCLDLIDWLRNTYKHCRTGMPVSARTADTYCQTFRTMLNEAVREGLITRNPWNLLETVEKIKKSESKREYLTIDEIKSMANAPCQNILVKKAYMFSCFTGLRISDVKSLKWSNITYDNGQAYVSIVMQKTTKPLYIPLSKQALKWLPEKSDNNSDSLVFAGLVNFGNINENIKSWANAAGISKHLSYHTSRHTFATMMLTLGADIYTVSKLLGHSSVRHTQIYARIIDRKKDEAVSLADTIF